MRARRFSFISSVFANGLLVAASTVHASGLLIQDPVHQGYKCTTARDTVYDAVIQDCTKAVPVIKTCTKEVKADPVLSCSDNNSRSADFTAGCKNEPAKTKTETYDCSTVEYDEICRVSITRSQGEMSDSEHTTWYTCAQWEVQKKYWDEERRNGGGSN